jgi:ribosomal protein L11 methylase PrmA
MQAVRLASSFRDPSGFVFRKGGVLFRQVNRSFAEPYRALLDSGLYQDLVDCRLLIPHEDVSIEVRQTEDAIAVIQPEAIPFISYPYEWSFSQYKEAALLTLELQSRALEKGMSMKDASAYNVQFRAGAPIFIDTLSFEIYQEGRPWIAYRQFCEHFLAPLALMAYVDPLCSKMMSIFIDGIPLEVASKMLAGRTKFKLGLKIHLHLHAKAQARVKEVPKSTSKANVSKTQLLGLVDSLQSTIGALKYEAVGTTWANYTNETNYSEDSRTEKRRLVSEFLDAVLPTPNLIWDLGANTGEYSRLASARSAMTVAWDLDPAAVEKCYLGLKQRPDPYLLPLVQDLSNPSPGVGWANAERDSLEGRGRADVVMALALVHHLAIGNNVPLPDVAAYLASLGSWLIIEFVPKEDSQTERLLQSRDDIFGGYTQEGFETAFGDWFELKRKEAIVGSLRTLYLYQEKGR